jgi:hypothetical protein
MYGFIKKDKAQYCPGEVCDIKQKYEIQKVSKKQRAVVFALFIVYYTSIYLFSRNFYTKTSSTFLICSINKKQQELRNYYI